MLTLVGAAKQHLKEPKGSNDCANFVSQCVREANAAARITTAHWASSGSVPTIVGEFPASAIEAGIGNAVQDDLIVFGDNEHVMIYESNGRVIGTSGVVGGGSTVQEVDASAVYTDHYSARAPGPIKTLHTGLGNSYVPAGGGGGLPFDANPFDAAAGALGALGGLWKGVTDVPGAIAAGVASVFEFVPVLLLNSGIVLVAVVVVLVGLDRIVSGVGGGGQVSAGDVAALAAA